MRRLLLTHFKFHSFTFGPRLRRVRTTVLFDRRHVVRFIGAVFGAVLGGVGTGSVLADELLPTFSAAEVSRHRGGDDGIWVTYDGAVYDVTSFVDQHPGGVPKLLLAAGGPLEPFWSMYRQHQTPNVRAILAPMKIGQLDGGVTSANIVPDLDNPYRDDPIRLHSMRVASNAPFNAEPPADILTENFTTPNPLFFVRNHLPVPPQPTAPNEYTLTVGEPDGGDLCSVTVEQLKNIFPPLTVTAAIQCAGNRRNEMNSVRPVRGLEWSSAVISNAVWTGVRLRDVLLFAGISDADCATKYSHCQFIGADADIDGTSYAASIPIERAMSPTAECLVAYEMNGEPIPRDHGAPLRAIIPGVVGARSVKWLQRIVPSAVESPSHWQQRDYKSFSPNVDWTNVDWTSAPSIQEMPVNSAICVPAPHTVVDPTDVEGLTVRGYAFSGGGRRIIRLDVSADGGESWQTANLTSGADQPKGRAWAWTLWETQVKLPNDRTDVTLCCRAIDDSYNTQPEDVRAIWNLRGVLNTAWHKVPIHIRATTNDHNNVLNNS